LAIYTGFIEQRVVFNTCIGELPTGRKYLYKKEKKEDSIIDLIDIESTM
jgi:hypothetical protein